MNGDGDKCNLIPLSQLSGHGHYGQPRRPRERDRKARTNYDVFYLLSSVRITSFISHILRIYVPHGVCAMPTWTYNVHYKHRTCANVQYTAFYYVASLWTREQAGGWRRPQCVCVCVTSTTNILRRPTVSGWWTWYVNGHVERKHIWAIVWYVYQ